MEVTGSDEQVVALAATLNGEVTLDPLAGLVMVMSFAACVLAEPFEELPEPEEELPEPAEELPEPAEELPEPAEEPPESAEELPEPAEELPEPAEELSEPDVELPELPEELPEPAEELPESAEELPEPAEELSEPDEELPGSVGALPGAVGVLTGEVVAFMSFRAEPPHPATSIVESKITKRGSERFTWRKQGSPFGMEEVLLPRRGAAEVVLRIGRPRYVYVNVLRAQAELNTPLPVCLQEWLLLLWFFRTRL